MNSFPKFLVVAALAGGIILPAWACDSCAVYLTEGAGRPGLALSIAQQFTRLGTVWQGDTRLGNPVGQYVDSFVTQVGVAYTRGGAWQTQITLPYLHRSYLRPEHAAIERGTESGPGDATITLRYRAWRWADARQSFAADLYGGLKFATGDSDHLGDEVGHHFHHHAGLPDSGVHGHDLALGSGSTDGLLGFDARWRAGRWLANASLQYKLRRPGAFDYRLADEMAWEIAAGRYLVLRHDRTLGLQALFSAEHKGLDTLGGEAQPDTGFSGRYAGGRVTASLGSRFTAEVALELPVRLRTSETMVVPDYRVRAAVNWRF